MCRSDLEAAFHLLQIFEGNPEILDILTLAFAVLAAYGWMIARPRRPLVDNLLVYRESPNDVIARKCSGCNKEQLDDPFAYWSKFDPDCYALWYHFRSNCGPPDCTTQNVNIIPLDNPIRYSRATQSRLEAKRLDRFDRWFLLRPEEFGRLPGQLKVRCQSEGCHPGFDITEYPRRPDIYFDTSLSIAGRVVALIEAQRLLETNRSIERKRKASEMK